MADGVTGNMAEASVRVCVRVRPLIAREQSATSENTEPVQLFWKCDKNSIHQIDDGNPTKSFYFDRVFSAEETTNQLYQKIAKPLVVSTVQGYNGTIFAYGQTCSGKTFTMMGHTHTPGVMPLAVEDVFQTIKNCPKKEFLLRVSYMEIYNETVTDLLVDRSKRKPLEVRGNKNIYVADLTEELVTSPAQALAWIQKGEKNRHYGKTKMNQRSSRSHTIFRMILESRESENPDGAIIVSHLNLVDLAGSERASQTGAEGARFKEGCNINLSLFTLGQVIKKLTDESQKGFTNYRDSKLTRILQNSLGGNAKTVIICTITPVTLEETLSTLQFASTAKKMKNDPHVTELSDDGSLLKRYRNEIADLKRQLQEVSSVTPPTSNEREVISQLLQEKDQLQKEQEDRIKNLTKLLVTSSNLDPVKKMPKRRVTWGGKMLKVSQASLCDGDAFQSCTRKQKADLSALTELCEEEEFDCQWEIPDEPSDDIDISQCPLGSPKSFIFPDQIHDISSNVSNLKMQLESECQQKEDALAKVEKLNGMVSELELQLEVKSREKDEASAKVDILDTRVSELELMLQTGAQHEAVGEILETGQKVTEVELQLHTQGQQKLEATEEAEFLVSPVADLERQLEEQSNTMTEVDQQKSREIVELTQLCEALATEKDLMVAERDHLKQELGTFMEQNVKLGEELKENRELKEFECLEEGFRKEHVNELQDEVSRLKQALELSELKCLELQNKMEAISEELRSKTEFAEQLQTLSGRDLVQEVAKLRRSLDDAEVVSRDTKKDWAVLRTANIALEEQNVTLTTNHKKMEAEVKSLRFQLESERSRYKTMQSDLQKELNVAFEENTKLTTLLDGKVPKNLIDGVELERKFANLNKELAASQEVERALKAQLEEMASCQTLPETVDNLKKQVCELTEELGSVCNHRDNLLTAQSQWHEETEQLRGSLQSSQEELLNIQASLDAAARQEDELSLQYAEKTQKLDSLRSELERCAAERTRRMQESVSKLEESEQLRAALEDKLKEMLQLVKDLEEKLGDSESCRTTEEEISRELREQVNQLTHELHCVRAEAESVRCERDSALQALGEMEKLLSTATADVEMSAEVQRQNNLHLEKEQKESEEMPGQSQELQCVREENEALPLTGVQGSAHETDKLLSALASLIAERDQLKMDMQENVDMMIEIQEELRAALENNQELKAQIKQLEAAQASTQDSPASEQLEELHTRIQQLVEHLERSRTEVNQLKSHLQENIQLMSESNEELRVSQEKISALQDEISMLRSHEAELDSRIHNAESNLHTQGLQIQMKRLGEELDRIRAEREVVRAVAQSRTEQIEELQLRVTSLSEEREMLQETLDRLRPENQQLRTELEEKMQSSTEELERLQCRVSSLSEKDHLHITVEQLRQEKTQIKAELENMVETQQSQMKTLTEKLQSVEAERDGLLSERRASSQTTTEELERLQCRVSSLSEEKDQLQETLEGMRHESDQLRAQISAIQQKLSEQEQLLLQQQTEKGQQEAELRQEMKRLGEELDRIRAEREVVRAVAQSRTEQIEELQLRVTSLSEEREMLQETLDRLRPENQQLRTELEEKMQSSTEELERLQCRVSSLSEEKDQLHITVEQLRQEKTQIKAELENMVETQQSQMKTLTEKLQSVEAERDGLLSERRASSQTTTEEMERLQCRVSSLSEEKDQLQETLEGMRHESDQLRAQISAIQQKLSEQEQLLLQQQTEKGQQEAELRQEMKRLGEELDRIRAEREVVRAVAQSRTEQIEELQLRVTSLSEEREMLQETLDRLRPENQQLRTELEKMQLPELETTLQTVSGQKEQQELQQYMYMIYKGQLEECFGKFQEFIDICSKYNYETLSECLEKHKLTSLLKPSMRSHSAILQTFRSVHMEVANIIEFLKMRAHVYRDLLKQLVKTDLAVFEEKQLHDVLLCRAQAPSSSVKDEDSYSLWEKRLAEQLDRRDFYQQEITSILGKFVVSMKSITTEMRAEMQERDRITAQLQNVDNHSRMDDILSSELDHLSAVVHSTKMTLQGVRDDHNSVLEKLKVLDTETEPLLIVHRSRNSTLLKALEGAPLNTEASLKDNQQLVLQLQQTEENLRALLTQNKQLEEAHVKASTTVSNQQQATELLQTELQDTRAQVEEKENVIQTLQNQLQEINASASAVETEKRLAKIAKLEAELSLSSDQHQQEIQRMNTLLTHKQESLRKLKEALRKAQQKGEQSFLEGEELHARLTNPKGLVVTSSMLLEKAKLQEEVKQLKFKITELESLISSQMAEINKWKDRAIKLKVREKTEVDKPSLPCTPTKRDLPMSVDSPDFCSPKKVLVTPKKALNSPRKLLDSPKILVPDFTNSRFLEVGESSELLSRNCPKQFDNSSLGTVPDAAAAAGSNKDEQWWTRSPKQQDMCHTQ